MTCRAIQYFGQAAQEMAPDRRNGVLALRYVPSSKQAPLPRSGIPRRWVGQRGMRRRQVRTRNGPKTCFLASREQARYLPGNAAYHALDLDRVMETTVEWNSSVRGIATARHYESLLKGSW